MVTKDWLKNAAKAIGYEYVEAKGDYKYWLVRKTSTGTKIPLPFETLGDMQQFLVLKLKSKISTGRSVGNYSKKDPWKSKVKLTPAQKKAKDAYTFALQQEDRYLSSVFANAHGQKQYEAKTKVAYEACKRLGMGCEQGM